MKDEYGYIETVGKVIDELEQVHGKMDDKAREFFKRVFFLGAMHGSVKELDRINHAMGAPVPLFISVHLHHMNHIRMLAQNWGAKIQ